MRIYLDNCCFGRPFDNQNFPRISIESKAVLFIQSQIKSGDLELATSDMLYYENDKSPFKVQGNIIRNFLEKYSAIHVGSEALASLKIKADEIISDGVKTKDAYHVAAAILAKCDYFLSTDDRLIRHKFDEIILLNPVDFLLSVFGEGN